MKRLLTFTLIFHLFFCCLIAQEGAKKTALKLNDTSDFNLTDVYSVSRDKLKKPDFIITKSDVEIPISFEGHQSLKNASGPSFSHGNSIYENHGLQKMPTFNVFTIVNTNAISLTELYPDTISLAPDINKFLPKDFNPYKGMFSDDYFSKSLKHPVISR